MERVALVLPASLTRDAALERISPLLGRETVAATVLSAAGSLETLKAEGEGPFHLYAEPDRPFRRIFVPAEFPLVYDNAFTRAWLALLLADAGEGGELWIECPRPDLARRRGRLAPEDLAEAPGAIAVEARGDGWHRLALAGSAETLREAAGRLPTSYAALHRRFDAFRELFPLTLAEPVAEPALTASAVRHFTYSLFGANQKSFVVERILAHYGLEGPLSGLDLGAGFGFLAAELAAKGHRMAASDLDPARIETIGGWLARLTGAETRMERFAGRIEDAPALADARPGAFDFVGYFGCLLYIPREHVPPVVEASMRLLKPGGLLLLHENPRDTVQPGTEDYEERFPSAELLAFLRAHAGEPTVFNVFNGQPTEWDKAARSLIMAAVRKPD